MATPTTLCGNCGSPLAHPAAGCLTCGLQAAAPPTLQRRSRFLAAALSVVPGLGHIYLGHKAKGLMTLAGFAGLQLFGADLDLTVVGAAVGVPMEMGGFGLWAWSIMDAYRLAGQEQVPQNAWRPGYR